VLISYRPVVPFSVKILAFEVQRPEPKGYPPPMVGTTAYHMGSEPVKLRVSLPGIGFSFDFPIAISHIQITKTAGWRTGTPSGRFVKPFHLGLGFRIRRVEIGTGLHHSYLQSGFRQNLGSHSSSCAGTYNAYIIDRTLFFYLKHKN